MRVTTEVRFAVIPEWILFAPISPTAVRLYGVLARHADKEQHFSIVGRGKLAEQMRCATDTIDRAMQELVEIGAVTVERRTDPNNVLHLLPNRYSLAVSPPDKAPAQTSRKRAATRKDAPSRTTAPSRTDAAVKTERVLGSKALDVANAPHTPPSAPRKRDPLFDAIAEAWMGRAAATSRIPRQAGGRIAEAKKQLTEIGASPEQVRAFGRQWREAKPGAECSPQAITGNWPTFVSGDLERQARGVTRRQPSDPPRPKHGLAADLELEELIRGA